MNKILKYKYEDQNKHFFSSDWHVFHDPKWEVPIWKMRGYESAEDSAEKILTKINEKVGENDILWFLGDMFLNATDEQCLQWLSRVNCQNIHTLWGNHSSNTFRIYRQAVLEKYGDPEIEVYPMRFNNVVFLGNYQEIYIGKKLIVLQHFPIKTWNNNSRNSFHLHGHSHNTDKSRNPEHPMGKCLDCSWDWKKDIWSFEEIEDVMSTKEMQIFDHH
jgi:calcineurin-like phosphoesterase family protein